MKGKEEADIKFRGLTVQNNLSFQGLELEKGGELAPCGERESWFVCWFGHF